LQESGKLQELKIKWWKNERGGGSCSVYIKMIFQLYVEEYCSAELRIKWWKNERGGGSCSVHKDDFSVISRRNLYSRAKDQMVEE
jgi:hypothetical protein